jgi:hypothetical protein
MPSQKKADARHASIYAYFDTVDDNRFEDCAQLFAEDALCVRPEPDGPRLVSLRGRAAILNALLTRGPRAVRHVVDQIAAEGDLTLAKGHIENTKVEAIFFVSAAHDEDGLIRDFTLFGGSLAPRG